MIRKGSKHWTFLGLCFMVAIVAATVRPAPVRASGVISPLWSSAYNNYLGRSCNGTAYDWSFTTATTGVVGSVTFTALGGTAVNGGGSKVLVQRQGTFTGSTSASLTNGGGYALITLTPQVPQLIQANTYEEFEIGELCNAAAGQGGFSTVATHDPTGAIIDSGTSTDEFTLLSNPYTLDMGTNTYNVEPQPAFKVVADQAGPIDYANGGYYHAGTGPVQQYTQVFLDFWGPGWTNGHFNYNNGTNTFCPDVPPTYCYGPTETENYIMSWFNGVGGSSWLSPLSQYCQGVTTGSSATACTSSNPYPRLQGAFSPTNIFPCQGETAQQCTSHVWFDSSLPTGGCEWQNCPFPAGGPLTYEDHQEAMAAANHFATLNGNRPQANRWIIYILGGPGDYGSTLYGDSDGFANGWCNYTYAGVPSGWPQSENVQWATVPFMPDAAQTGCDNQEQGFDAFGHGWFDSYSLSFAQTLPNLITDPLVLNFDDQGESNNDVYEPAWINYSEVSPGADAYDFNQVADPCLFSNMRNITLGSNYFWMEGFWSDTAGGCT